MADIEPSGDGPRLLTDAEVMGGGRDGPRLLSDDDVMGRGAAKKEVPLAARPFVGANRGIADFAGAPVDIATFGINKVSQGVTAGVNALTGSDFEAPQIKDPIGGSGTFKKAMGLVGANPDDVRPAESTAEKLLEAGGEGAAGMVVPGLGAEALLARTIKESETLGNAMLKIIAGTGTRSNTAIGAGAGVGGEVAAEIAPDPLKPAARMVGGLVGGGAVALGHAAAEGTVQAGKTAVQALTEPAELRAARIVDERAANPSTLRQNLNEAVEQPELVPGSRPTTFQASGDLGLGALERETANSKGGVEAFAGRRQEQNAARLEALGKLADPQADAATVTDFVRSRLQSLTDEHTARVGTAARGVTESLAKAGGEAFDNPAAYGEALREPLAGLHQRAKDEASALWRAIDPDMNAPVNVQSLKETTAELAGTIPKTAKPPSGEEASILKTIEGLGENADFGNMVALRSRLTDAMRDERRNGAPTVLRRLTIMLDNVDDTLARTAGEIAADPQRSVGLSQRLQGWVSEWRARKADDGVAIEARRGAEGSDEGLVPGAAGGVPPARGAEGEARGGPGSPAGAESVQGPAGFTADVGERYGAARTATRELKQTYESGPVGGVLAPGAQHGSFRTTASNVARNLFDKPESLTAFIDAAKDNPEALNVMRDYAAFSLRKAAVRDGIISPGKLQQWVDSHGYVFREFPELRAKFADAKAAQATLDDALAAQKQALADYQTGTVRQLLGGADPVKAVGAALAKPGDFAALVATAGKDPTAVAGLKRATVDFIMSRALSTAEAGTSELKQIKSATLQQDVINNQKTLGLLFSPEELGNMRAVAADLQRANRSIVAVKNPGGSDSAQNMLGRLVATVKSFAADNAGRLVGAVVGGGAGGPGGSIAGYIAGNAVDSMLAARAARIDQAVVDMMLDPKMAAVWLAKIPQNAGASVGENFARRLRALTADQVMQAMDEEAKR